MSAGGELSAVASRPPLPPGYRSSVSRSFEPSSDVDSQVANFAAASESEDFSGTK